MRFLFGDTADKKRSAVAESLTIGFHFRSNKKEVFFGHLGQKLNTSSSFRRIKKLKKEGEKITKCIFQFALCGQTEYTRTVIFHQKKETKKETPF